MANRILVVDDDAAGLYDLQHILRSVGYDVTAARNGQKALKFLEEEGFDLVLTELMTARVDGMRILQRTKEVSPDTEVVVITGTATVDTAIDAIKSGAYHYFAKPFNADELKRVIAEALEKMTLKAENAVLRERLDVIDKRANIVTDNQRMKRLLEIARQIAPSDCNVIITGESGTGKELLANFIHLNSSRPDGPMLALNCGVFGEELLANELFGHEKGAFTGADSMKKGLIEMADGGTLFLDEITEMSTQMQVKLLRVIQEKQMMRVGGTSPIRVDVRYVAATNRDLLEAVGEGDFRQDLYFRLNVVTLNIPPLSERKDDIPLLAHYFLRRFSHSMEKDVGSIDPEVLSVFMNYDFPGNVRELENIIERGVALATEGVIETVHLPDDLKTLNIRTFRKKDGQMATLEEHELEYIQFVLREFGGNRSAAAHALGIDRVSLWRKIKKAGLAV